MRSVWQSLAWKEWHEHKWKLAALTGVLCGVTGVALLALLREDFNSLDGFIPALIMGMIPLTLFIGMGEAAGENTNRTMPFLQSLPVPMWKAAVWKLVFGTITCLTPILLTLLLIAVWYGFADLLVKHPQTVLRVSEVRLFKSMAMERPLGAWILSALVMSGSISVSLFIWTAALGVNRKNEVAAGGVALLGIVGWWFVIFVLASLAEDWSRFGHFQKELLDTLILAASPGGLSLVLSEGGPRTQVVIEMAVLAAISTHLLLARWYVLRFGRAKNIGAFSPLPASRPSARADWLGLPRRSPFTAILWKQFHESGPIAVAGLAAIIFIFAVLSLTNSGYYLSPANSPHITELLVGLTVDIGFLTTLIVGIGAFDRDLSPQLNTFWRSRPIDPNLLFWCKYLTGLTVLAGALLIPLGIISLVNWRWAPYGSWPHYLEGVVMGVGIFLAVYALSVAAICTVRVTLYAAILSMGVLAGGVSLAWFFLDSNNTEWTATDWAYATSVLTLTTAVLATLVGWWAVRRNVGWKK
jgi:ABC-type transport system involved in multi-copper enzyme maturation permease subunit